MMTQMALEALIEPLLKNLGYVLWGSEFRCEGKQSCLRIYIDKPQGVNINDCEVISHAVSALLDVEEPFTDHDIPTVSQISTRRKRPRQKEHTLDVHDQRQGRLQQSCNLKDEGYKLEISSPGIPKPLFKLHQYEAYIGHHVTIKLGYPIDGTRKIIGVIESVCAHDIMIRGTEHLFKVPVSSIIKAHLCV